MKILASIRRGLRFAGLVIVILSLVVWFFLKALFTGRLREFFKGIDPYEEDDENF